MNLGSASDVLVSPISPGRRAISTPNASMSTETTPAAWLMLKFRWAFLNSSRKPFSKMLTSLMSKPCYRFE